MGRNVFANGHEISAKASDNKSIAATPDVCLSPPSPPAGPVPIPYPNTAVASDTSEGSKTVMIGGKEVGLKDKSTYKKSSGDEAATKSLGMGVISHNIQGPMRFAAWSSDVKVEGENVTRNLDLTTHNHLNPSQVPTVSGAAMQPEEPTDCKELTLRAAKEREELQKNKQYKSATMKPGEVCGDKTTVTAAQVTTPQGTFGMKACSRWLDFMGKEGFARGLTTDQQDAGETNIDCEEAYRRKFRYKGTGDQGHATHTESRLIETIRSNPANRVPGVKLVMSINWQSAEVVNSPGSPHHGEEIMTVDDSPCAACKRTICAAQACGMEIVICNKDTGEPKPKEDCPDELHGGPTEMEQDVIKMMGRY